MRGPRSRRRSARRRSRPRSAARRSRPGVVSLAAAVARGLAISAAVKAAAIVLAVVSMISAGAGIAALAGRQRRPTATSGRLERQHRPATLGVDRNELAGRMADQPGRRDLQAAGRRLGRDLRQPQLPALKGLLKGKELTLKYNEGARHADSTIKLDDSGRSFAGPYRFGEGQRDYVNTRWQGWRPIPRPAKGRRAGSTASG